MKAKLKQLGTKPSVPKQPTQNLLCSPTSLAGELPADRDAALPSYEVGSSQASRVSSKEMIQALSKAVPSSGWIG
ncbi:hypothetical protein [Enterococcus casseliflavus]|uniref:hypothetical protein n=1 Tax=Enterococcus casseliflavus TaxID=37734 RepID=UPI003BEF3DD5